jgi:hypothetical protein
VDFGPERAQCAESGFPPHSTRARFCPAQSPSL